MHDVHLLGKNKQTTKEGTETLSCISNETDLQVNTEKTVYLSCEKNVGQSHNILRAN
jgi:hypothetical protein